VTALKDVEELDERHKRVLSSGLAVVERYLTNARNLLQENHEGILVKRTHNLLVKDEDDVLSRISRMTKEGELIKNEFELEGTENLLSSELDPSSPLYGLSWKTSNQRSCPDMEKCQAWMHESC